MCLLISRSHGKGKEMLLPLDDRHSGVSLVRGPLEGNGMHFHPTTFT